MEIGKHSELGFFFLESGLLNMDQHATGNVAPFVIVWRENSPPCPLWSHQKVFRTYFMEMNQRNQLSI